MIGSNERVIRKKVLVMTSTFPRWAGDHGPRFVFELCRHLCTDFDVTVLAPHAPGAKTNEILDGIRVVRFRYFFEWGESLAYQAGILPNLRSNPLRYVLVPGFLVLQFIALIRLLHQQKFSAIHAHWLIPQGFVATVSRFLLPNRPPLLITVHGSDLHSLRSTLFLSLQRFVMARCDSLVAVSAAMKSQALGLGAKPEATFVASMGIDTSSVFTPSQKIVRTTNEVLYVGRLSTQKGLNLLIRAMPKVLSVYPDCKLRIVGQGPSLPEMQAMAEDSGIAGNVSFLGPMASIDLAQIYREAALLVFPSISEEGFGLVCVEAMACECPVIAANQPATREIINDGVTGVLFNQGDWDDLACQIITLLNNPALRCRIGINGRKSVTQHFDWKIISGKYRELLNNIIL